ncbi:MAG TPA: GNAT family protein [Candidatus Methylomirabilis sp.]|nr:GNAT family protein [Candidatus Methylomirabilis sp.]
MPEPLHIEPVTLEGAHVRLEPLSMAHYAHLSQVGLDEELVKITQAYAPTPDGLRAYIEKALQRQADGTALPFAVIAKAVGRAIGSSRYAAIDRTNRRLEIGWTWYGRAFQRTVVNTECKYLLLRYAFETLGCISVEFKTDVLNERSRAALLRIGAKEEGVLRHHQIMPDGRLRDTVYFSIINYEWPQVKARLEGLLVRSDPVGSA